MRGQRRIVLLLPAALFTTLVVLAAAPAADEKKSADSGGAPTGAIVLFDGKDLSGWQTLGQKEPGWMVENGYMEVKPGKGDIRTKETFGPDCQLHVEFWLPLMADQKGQGRSNSGVYLQGRYEIQVLDSFMNETYANGSVGALYGIITPDKAAHARAIKPPEQWQTFDINFHAPRVDDQGKVTEKGHVTVVLNGVTIIDNGEFDKVTGSPLDEKIGSPGPLRLQDHGCKVRYRNIWLQPLSGK
jgi:hypothetical protein